MKELFSLKKTYLSLIEPRAFYLPYYERKYIEKGVSKVSIGPVEAHAFMNRTTERNSISQCPNYTWTKYPFRYASSALSITVLPCSLLPTLRPTYHSNWGQGTGYLHWTRTEFKSRVDKLINKPYIFDNLQRRDLSLIFLQWTMWVRWPYVGNRCLSDLY
jgi:hypothetical protein